jgi:hypothetical protein
MLVTAGAVQEASRRFQSLELEMGQSLSLAELGAFRSALAGLGLADAGIVPERPHEGAITWRSACASAASALEDRYSRYL